MGEEIGNAVPDEEMAQFFLGYFTAEVSWLHEEGITKPFTVEPNVEAKPPYFDILFEESGNRFRVQVSYEGKAVPYGMTPRQFADYSAQEQELYGTSSNSDARPTPPAESDDGNTASPKTE